MCRRGFGDNEQGNERTLKFEIQTELRDLSLSTMYIFQVTLEILFEIFGTTHILASDDGSSRKVMNERNFDYLVL